jgi:hypothetical protein
MGDIGVEFIRSTFDVSQILRTSQSSAALVAVVAAKMIFRTAAAAASGHLAAGHGDERTVGPFDDL